MTADDELAEVVEDAVVEELVAELDETEVVGAVVWADVETTVVPGAVVIPVLSCVVETEIPEVVVWAGEVAACVSVNIAMIHCQSLR